MPAPSPVFGVGAGGAAVVEVAQRLQALGDDRVARDAGERGDEGDAARVVLESGVVEALGGPGSAAGQAFAS